MHILTEFEAVCVDFGKVRQPRNYVELRDRWQKRGLSSLFTLACIYFSCTCSHFSFCIRLDDVFRYEEKLFKLSWSFQSSICHKVVVFSGITDYIMLGNRNVSLQETYVLSHFSKFSYDIEGIPIVVHRVKNILPCG